MQSIYVAVVHDNFLARTGLTTTFAACDDMTVSEMATDDAELLRCDVVVADPRSGMSILDAVRRQRAHARVPRVAIVASSDLEWQIRDAVEHGVSAYLQLGATAPELVGAVRTVHAGGYHLAPPIAAKLAASLTAEPLTVREQEVLVLVTDGLCNKRIAARLDIAVGTVKTHLRSAFDKLRVRSRTEAVAMAERRGLLRHSKASTEAPVSRAHLPVGATGQLGGEPREPSRRPALRDVTAGCAA
jgi:DNA-binding NarL/FixJ family response regulator